MGALNVWLDEYEALIVLHLALGTLLWATVVGLALQLYPVRRAGAALRAARRGAKAVHGLMARSAARPHPPSARSPGSARSPPTTSS